jgi:hypothetical protein
MRCGPWLGALVLFGSASCATTATVASGHAAVITSANGDMQAVGEGAIDVPADARVDDFDLRQQILGGSFAVNSADGMPLVARDPVISVRVIPDEIVAADARTGPDGWRALVTPIVHAAIAKVIATYRWDELTPDAIRLAQARITQLAAQQLRPLHVLVTSVELKGLAPRSPGLRRTITDTSIWEQRSLQARLRLDVAQKQADSLRAQAAGIAAANQAIAPTLLPGVLVDKANQAWQRLLSSPATTVQVTTEPATTLEVSP